MCPDGQPWLEDFIIHEKEMYYIHYLSLHPSTSQLSIHLM